MMERKQSNIGFNHLLFLFVSLSVKNWHWIEKISLLQSYQYSQALDSKVYNFEERKRKTNKHGGGFWL